MNKLKEALEEFWLWLLEFLGINAKLTEQPTKGFETDNKRTVPRWSEEVVARVDLKSAILKMVDLFVIGDVHRAVRSRDVAL